MRKGEEATPETQATITGLDKTFAIAEPTKQDMKLYRGIGISHRGEKMFEIGDEFHDKGFVSTTNSIYVARSFARMNEGAVVEIVIPKGTKVVAPIVSPNKNREMMGRIRPAERIGAEEEVLLNRGARFVITGRRSEGVYGDVYEARMAA